MSPSALQILQPPMLTFFALLTLENNCMSHVIETFYEESDHAIIIEHSFIIVTELLIKLKECFSVNGCVNLFLFLIG